MMIKTALFIFVLSFVEIYAQYNTPNNPCPSIFRYVYDGQVWLGHITVNPPHPSKNIATISANFSVEGTLASEGKISLHDVDNALQRIRNGRQLTFIVHFTKHNYLPTVTQIEFNGIVICSGPKVSVSAIGSVTNFWLQYTFKWSGVHVSPPIYHTISPEPPIPVTFSPPVYTPQPNSYDDLYTTSKTTKRPARIRFRNYRECGLIRKRRNAADDDESDPVNRIINGTQLLNNSHPWLAALFDDSKPRVEFFCAGNLISSKHVLSAAHCTIKKNDRVIEVRLGIHNLATLFDPGTVKKRVITTLEHPDYKHGNAYADVSIIVLDSEVLFTPAITPICLWNYDPDFQTIVGYIATIMGWGVTENGDASMVPLRTDVTISDKQKCKENELLKDMVTDETFCAGSRGTGPCLGDSGGGLFLALDGKWYLRGIISTSIADRYTSICDANTYSVYVDTAKYLDWIANNME